MNTDKFEEFISQYPIFEYRILDTKDIGIEERVRTICKEECERYDSTWACPPAVGTLQECERKIKSYPQAVFFSSVAEVSDIMNMEEMLSTRRAHEDLTLKPEKLGKGITYTSSDYDVANVTADGKVIPFKEGKVTITCCSYGASKYVSKIVVVIGKAARDISIKKRRGQKHHRC